MEPFCGIGNMNMSTSRKVEARQQLEIQFLVGRRIAIATSGIWEEALKLADSKLSLYYLLTSTELSTH